ncbi:phytanoyl-CoA dioxygenase family protein [bacterium]|nr:phytanoyl-CoA dioxygenase family protein [bacterium]
MRTETLEKNGWLLLDSVYTLDHLERLRGAVQQLQEMNSESVREQAGSVYAARNVLEIVPEVATLWKTPKLVSLISEVLGADAGLIRALYFDKPPEQTWALPWHKDLLIAVSDETVQLPGYSKPRPRAGVLHTEPPVKVLQSMLTLRIHLDPMTTDNGPLEVLSGSHQTGKELQVDGFQREQITSEAGAVFVMRPLLVHASGRSIPNAKEHRRVLHLEFTGIRKLPQGVEWHTYIPIIKNL